MNGSIDILYFLKGIGTVKEQLDENQIKNKERFGFQLVMTLKNIINHRRQS